MPEPSWWWVILGVGPVAAICWALLKGGACLLDVLADWYSRRSWRKAHPRAAAGRRFWTDKQGRERDWMDEGNPALWKSLDGGDEDD